MAFLGGIIVVIIIIINFQVLFVFRVVAQAQQLCFHVENGPLKVVGMGPAVSPTSSSGPVKLHSFRTTGNWGFFPCKPSASVRLP